MANLPAKLLPRRPERMKRSPSWSTLWATTASRGGSEIGGRESVRHPAIDSMLKVRGYRMLEAANGRETGVSGLDPCGSALIKT
jgi:hypothetical protein